jgi:hypothetical protein
MTFNRHPYMMIIMNFVPESSIQKKSVDKSMIVKVLEQSTPGVPQENDGMYPWTHVERRVLN